MPTHLFRMVGEELTGLGLETVSEEHLTNAGQVLVDMSLTIPQNERVKRFVMGILMLVPNQFRRLIPAAARWNLALTKTALKRYARKSLRHLSVPESMTQVIIDAIDDTVEKLQSHVERDLTAEALEGYVASAITSRTTPQPAAASAATHGVTMSSTSTPKPLGPPEGFSLSAFYMRLSPLGKKRWAKFNQRYLTAAAPGTSEINEPVSPRVMSRAVTIAVWRDETGMLEILDDHSIENEEAIWAFTGTAMRYVGDGETRREDQIGDAVDALTTGRTRQLVRDGVEGVARGVVWATPWFAAFAAIVIAGSVGACLVLVGLAGVIGYAGLIDPVTGAVHITLSKMITASLCLVGAGVVLIPLHILVETVRERWQALVNAATGPFAWAGKIIEAYAAARGFPINPTTEKAAH